MPPLSWETFATLPGATTRNFESLCRALIKRHYGQFGDFRALANQPGVEFHLKLHSQCTLGDAGRWHAWQCKWYDLPSGRAIGATRKKKITDALIKSADLLPGLTDWTLWTRYELTKADQEWFYGLPSHCRLNLWTSADVEEHLSGPAEILRGTHFGELILTSDALRTLHAASVAPLQRRWLPQVHQTVAIEREIHRLLGAPTAWTALSSLASQVMASAEAMNAAVRGLPATLEQSAAELAEIASSISAVAQSAHAHLANGDLELLAGELRGPIGPPKGWDTFARRARAARHPCALHATNLIEDVRTVIHSVHLLKRALDCRMFAVLAPAGQGKTQLSAQLTSELGPRPAGVLLHGRDLHARQNLDHLARQVSIQGAPAKTFEALVAAADAAGRRAKGRLPIVIDGLNEAEDPRDWKPALASVQDMLSQYPHVLLLCTLRPDCAEDALFADMDHGWHDGFGEDLEHAIQRYFEHYRIDMADAVAFEHLFDHPLLLRMFCEVTNPEREQSVGVEAMPTSLASLFEQYLTQVAARISELAPRHCRYVESDVRSSLARIGLALWKKRARAIDKEELRTLLDDTGRPWDQSIVRAMEQDGILIRRRSSSETGSVAILFDRLAGHIVANSLLDHVNGDQFEAWIQKDSTVAALGGGISHTLASDILAGLVALVPRRIHGRQVWPLLQEPLRTRALHGAATLEANLLDEATVTELRTLLTNAEPDSHGVLNRLRLTRAAHPHPLNAEFLDKTLRAMSIADRDLCWTEWLRHRDADLATDILKQEDRWKQIESGQEEERLRALWVMWVQTSTVRLLRDHATRALYHFGSRDPVALFELTLSSLEINDVYVPERMLATCYGVAMSLWAAPEGEAMRAALPGFADTLIDQLLMPGATHATRHFLLVDSALGLVTLADRIQPGCIPGDKRRHAEPPFDHLPTPFPDPSAIQDADVKDAQHAIRMDFGNYTLGGLTPDRHNYDDTHARHGNIRRQIEARIVALGYSSSRFGEVDQAIASQSWRRQEGRRVDRYGKKYSWIAYFEMYGLVYDQGQLSEERDSDVGIDPSFPATPRTWSPDLPALFAEPVCNPRAWIANGPIPDFDHLLKPDTVDEQRGPWALLEGYVDQHSAHDDRRVFSFLRGVFVDRRRVEQLFAMFDSRPYPGNQAIPEPSGDYYTYAGEIPWSHRFGTHLRDPTGKPRRDVRNAFDSHDGKRWQTGIPVEVPVVRHAWESYHSALNQVSGVLVPAPAICEHLRLANRPQQWNLYDDQGALATLYRRASDHRDANESQFAYLRSDLLVDYLKTTKQAIVWLVWGERTFHHRSRSGIWDDHRDLWREHQHIHRSRVSWDPTA